MARARQPDALFAGFGLRETIPLEVQHVAHELAVLVVVLDDEE